ncbi:unnamed protein product [Owenia fusiformis]|uniref:ShKT domain-containing protein n=1 Tax=Owenia fusiformis TaxID=6347 RepID=A0A8S4P092_OWEFU|nr:unnamed protein product [Owenia fusiformis]
MVGGFITIVFLIAGLEFGCNAAIPLNLDESHYYIIYPSHNSGNSLYYGGNRPGSPTNSNSCGNIRGVPSKLRSGTHMYPKGLTSFYQKYTEAYDIPVVSSNQVSNDALKRACYTLRFMLADRSDIRNAFYKAGGRVAIIGVNEGTTSIPEHSNLPAWWNERARGLGATWAQPVSTAGEENARCLPNDRYKQDIVLHEFSHALHLIGANNAISGFHDRLSSTVEEYWAEGVQSYFGVNRHSDIPDGIQGPISNRNALRNYDIGLYNIIKEVFPCNNDYIKRCQKNRGAELNQQLKINCGSTGGGNGGDGGNITPRPTRPTVGGCQDQNQHCQGWQAQGLCSSNEYVKQNCRMACGTCGGGVTGVTRPSGNCQDQNQHCQGWQAQGYCNSNEYVKQNCQKACGTCGGGGTGVTPSGCADKDQNCQWWSQQGECTRKEYVKQNCKRSCQTCGGAGSGCRDQDQNCQGWRTQGYCSTNDYVKQNCRAACGTC